MSTEEKKVEITRVNTVGEGGVFETISSEKGDFVSPAPPCSPRTPVLIASQGPARHRLGGGA